MVLSLLCEWRDGEPMTGPASRKWGDGGLLLKIVEAMHYTTCSHGMRWLAGYGSLGSTCASTDITNQDRARWRSHIEDRAK